jgi:hypothetical protein
MICYLVLAFLSAFQLTRIFRAVRCQYWLMSVEHSLILVLCLLRAFNMVLYWKLYAFVDFQLISIISGAPQLLTSWVFTLVIFAWASIYYSSEAGSRETNPFKKYRYIFIIINTVICAIMVFFFVYMAIVKDIVLKKLLYNIGTSFVSIVNIMASFGFMVYNSCCTFVSNFSILCLLFRLMVCCCIVR